MIPLYFHDPILSAVRSDQVNVNNECRVAVHIKWLHMVEYGTLEVIYSSKSILIQIDCSQWMSMSTQEV